MRYLRGYLVERGPKCLILKDMPSERGGGVCSRKIQLETVLWYHPFAWVLARYGSPYTYCLYT